MPDRMVLLFRPKAEDDLELIYTYTENIWGHEQAEKYLDYLYSSIQELLNYPEVGVKYTREKMEYRKIVVGKHVIYYRVSDKGIVVVRVLHSKMNLETRLD